MGRGKRRLLSRVDRELPLSDGGRQRRTPLQLRQALEPSAEERRDAERQYLLAALLPYFCSSYGLEQAFDIANRETPSWIDLSSLPTDSEAIGIATFLEAAQAIDELTSNRLATGDWMRTPHYNLPFADPAGYDWIFPSRFLCFWPEQRQQVLAAAQDDFQHGSREHRRRIEQKGFLLGDEGATSTPQDPDYYTVGLSPYFHRPPRDLNRPTLAG
jgi:hypothetical protein